MYVLHFVYPFIHQWIPGLLPPVGLDIVSEENFILPSLTIVNYTSGTQLSTKDRSVYKKKSAFMELAFWRGGEGQTKNNN